jgi:hypothetical protein
MACADMREIGLATDWGWDRFDNLGRAVPVRSSVIRFSVNLDELGKIDIGTKAFFHSSDVRFEPVRRDLRPACYPLAEVSDKL